MIEQEEVIKTIEGYKFLAIDHKDEQIIIVMSEVQNGYRGFSLSQDNTGYSLSPCFIATTFIKSNDEKRFDFTNNLKECFDYLIARNHIG